MHAADIISLRNLRESSRIIKIQIIYFLVVAGKVPLLNSLFYVVQSSRMLGYLLVVPSTQHGRSVVAEGSDFERQTT